MNELYHKKIKGERKIQGVPQSQAAALPRHQEEEETDKTRQAQIEQTVRKALRLALSSPKRGNRHAKKTEKHNNKITPGKKNKQKKKKQKKKNTKQNGQ